ncbi:MAG: chloride channel protein [Streptococcus sp.]|nr:chloride channel protein [Streptococcus sp.]
MKKESRAADIKKEFHFASSSIISQVFRGVLVGIIVGAVVGAFRYLIEEGFHLVQSFYIKGQQNFIWIILIVGIYLLILFLNARLARTEKNIKGSGIPQIEAELKGLMSQSWWSILWKKFTVGVLAISSGLMLGREGPSIQLGAMSGKGFSKLLKLSPVEERTLIASGAAAGLAAAFNAPIAGLLFIVEEVYHHFSRFFWVSTLAASLVANFVSQSIFGLTPVLDMPDNIPVMDLNQYWIYLLMGIFLGFAAYLYEKVILNIHLFYNAVSRVCKIPKDYYPIVAFLLILPIGYFFPQLLGGGNQLILSINNYSMSIGLLVTIFLLRFIWSMISYGSGLPGGIFLPILALGSLLGGIVGIFCIQQGLIEESQFPIFIILGMSGYFGAISKAPLTAIILVTEMVGDIRNLMPLALVTLVAYIIMDLMKGAPVYEAMLEQMLPDNIQDNGETTLIEIPVSEKISGKQVHELELPRDVLITMNVHKGKTIMVNGGTRLYLGDTIYLVVKKSEIGKIKDLLL